MAVRPRKEDPSAGLLPEVSVFYYERKTEEFKEAECFISSAKGRGATDSVFNKSSAGLCFLCCLLPVFALCSLYLLFYVFEINLIPTSVPVCKSPPRPSVIGEFGLIRTAQVHF